MRREKDARTQKSPTPRGKAGLLGEAFEPINTGKNTFLAGRSLSHHALKPAWILGFLKFESCVTRFITHSSISERCWWSQHAPQHQTGLKLPDPVDR